jgi:facilitated trehalose transporter
MGSTIDPYSASIALGVTRLCMSLLNAWFLKRFKRRHLLMASGAGMGICMFISGLYTKWIQEGTTTLVYVPIIFMLLYVCTSMIGLLTIPWIMSAEVFPTEIRGIAHSISYCFANVIMFAAIKSYRYKVHSCYFYLHSFVLYFSDPFRLSWAVPLQFNGSLL